MQETQETHVQSLGWADPLEKGMATHSSTFAWRIRRTEEPSGLQSMGSQRVRPTEQLTLSQFHVQAVRQGWYPVAPSRGQTSCQTCRWMTPVDDAGGQGFPGGSAGEESACNAGDPGSIPGLGRATGEGIGYPLQYFWAALVAQLVKNPPVMQETLV